MAKTPYDKTKAAAYYVANREKIKAASRARSATNSERRHAANAVYRATHRESIAAQKAAWQVANREHVSARKVAYNQANRERIAKQKAIYQEENREHLRITSAAWRLAHREHRRIVSRAWKKANPDKVQANTERRRAWKAHATINDFTAQQWQEMQARYHHRCVYCGKRAKGRLTQDHITPLIRGGNHTFTNIVPACRSCNSRKGRGEALILIQPLLLL